MKKKQRLKYSKNGRRALRHARVKGRIIKMIKRRLEDNDVVYEREPFFDSTEEFFNFLFGTITAIVIFISIFKFAPEMFDPHGVVNTRGTINNNFNYTNMGRNRNIQNKNINQINKNDSAF